jgi:hypothetical protein
MDKVYVVYIVADKCKLTVISGRVAEKSMKVCIVVGKTKLM